MNITDTLHDFFKTRPAVSVAGLALDADVFRTTIYRSMNGERIKPESERRLREAMRKYGYEPVAYETP
jgi:DNA-binding LacI/PurR family transcriptional regulator